MAQKSRSSSSVLNLGMNLSGSLFLFGFIQFPFFTTLVSGRDDSDVFVSDGKANN